ncbi:unnamed protein product [Paramecium sonneborni]|uniref:Uncharacterized protein n=1 Tax=Paramecium sonneborni TaxID=65129 RepID=A0A8S1RCN4_9CILI|nr:unnamed protein product [Paramecium sonneborni]
MQCLQQLDFLNSGYCQWNRSSCVLYTTNQDCYKIDEIKACQPNGKYQTICCPLNLLSIYYKNVCRITTIIEYNFIRYSIKMTGYPQFLISSLIIAQLKIAQQQIKLLISCLNYQYSDCSQQGIIRYIRLISFINISIYNYYKFNLLSYRETFCTSLLFGKNADSKFCKIQEMIHIPQITLINKILLLNSGVIVQGYQQKMVQYIKNYQTNYYFKFCLDYFLKIVDFSRGIKSHHFINICQI